MKYLIFFSIVLIFLSSLNTKPIEIHLIQKEPTLKTIIDLNKRFLLATTVPIKVDSYDGDYVTTIGLGTPFQTFDVEIDTTSSISWVPSSKRFKNERPISNDYNAQYGNNTNNNSNLTNNNNLNQYAEAYQNQTNEFNSSFNKYDETQSRTSANTNRTIEIEYDNGDVKGVWTYDTVEIANKSVEGFAFVQVTKYDKDYDDHNGGKLGLGLHSKHGEKFSILSALKSAGHINRKMFSIVKTGKTKNLFIGEYPISTYFSLNKFSKCNISSSEGLDDEYKDGWVCDLSHVLLGNVKNLTQALEVDGRVIFDSVYKYIRAPKNYNKYFKNFFNSKNITNCKDTNYEDEKRIVCSNKNDFSKLGSISFLLDGTSYRIPAEELFEQSGEGYEFLIRFSDDKDNIWILGSPFMDQYTVVFDMEDFNVGFSGGNKDEFQIQWQEWYEGNSQADKANRFFYMIVGASIFGSILFIFIVFLIFHSIRRKRLEEHGPLINEKH